MSATIEFFYDYASPFSYLADHQLPAIAARTGATIAYRPALLGAVVIESGNTPPPTVPAKLAWLGVDMARWVKRLGIPHAPNPHFPVRSVTIMRAALVAQDLGVFPAYHAAMWRGMWQEALDLADPDTIRGVLERADLDADALLDGTRDEAIKARLKANNDEALARGAFGLPVCWLGDEMFFGNDRLDFLEEALVAAT